MSILRNWIIVLILATILLSPGCTSQLMQQLMQQPVNETGTIDTTPPAIAVEAPTIVDTPTLIEHLKKTVVHINYTGTSEPDFWGYTDFELIGSGIIYSIDDNNVYVLTNRHVVDYNFPDYYTSLKSEEIEIRTSDGDMFSATQRFIAPDNLDLAILVFQKPPADLSTVSISDNLPAVGEDVLIIGMPEELDWSVSKGIVSGLREFEIEASASGNDYTAVQTDAAINPGNSGGGMFTMDGMLVGINTWKYIGFDVEGLNFAISGIDFITHKDGFQSKPLLTEWSLHTPGDATAFGIAELSYDDYSPESPLELSFSLVDTYGYETVSSGTLDIVIEDESRNQLYSTAVEVDKRDFREVADFTTEPIMLYTVEIPRSEVSESEEYYGYATLSFTTSSTTFVREVFIVLPSDTAGDYLYDDYYDDSYSYDDYYSEDYYYDDYGYDDYYYYDDYGYEAAYKPIGESVVMDEVKVTLVEGAFYELYYGEYEYDLVVEFENTGSQEKEMRIKDAALVLDKKQYGTDFWYGGDLGTVYPGASVSTNLYFYVDDITPENATLYLEFRVIEGNQLESYDTRIEFTP